MSLLDEDGDVIAVFVILGQFVYIGIALNKAGSNVENFFASIDFDLLVAAARC